ncbi:MAG: phosphatase PAP2 family protein [Acidobacteriota bacterium]
MRELGRPIQRRHSCIHEAFNSLLPRAETLDSRRPSVPGQLVRENNSPSLRPPKSFHSIRNARLLRLATLSFVLFSASPFDAAVTEALPVKAEVPVASKQTAAEIHPVTRHLHLALRDAREIFSAPARWDSRQWKRAGLFAGAVVASSALDEPVRKFVDDHHSRVLDNVTRVAEPFGGVYAQHTMLAFALIGAVTRDSNARETAFDGYMSTLIAAGVITPALKRAFGRSRPNANRGTFDFDPVNGGESFPSGHSTEAFTLATVVASHYHQRWIQATAYGLASTVAFSRLYHDAHFTSDVLAGALIGTGVGRAVVRINNRERLSWSVAPGVSPTGRREILFTLRF